MSESTIPPRSPEERRAALALTLVADVGSVTYRKLNERFRSPARALEREFAADVVQAAYAEADAQIALGTARGLSLTAATDDQYPSALRELHDPPAVLWSIGAWSTLTEPVVAVVGTRRATAYGHRITRELVAALVRAGACIVSGMALGIDAVAHQTALELSGRTVAVLGTGADIAYPRGHLALHRAIAESGLVLSELPPGERAGAGSFPRRNRIIAGLARLTIVVEAPARSGALLTARYAADLGRDVAAVAGPIDMPQSEGTNELIRDGAHPIMSIADAVTLAGLHAPRRVRPSFDDVSDERVWTVLDQRVSSLDELCARAALPVAECLGAVTRLELRGMVECALTGEIRRR